MPTPPENPMRRNSVSLPQAASTTPRTRLFWVPFDEPVDEQSDELIKTPEQIYQEAVMDALENLHNEQTASQPPPVPHMTSQPPASPPEPSRDVPVPPADQTTPPQDSPESQLSVASQPLPDAPPPPRPSSRHRRQKSASSSKHQPSPTSDSPPSQDRIRVRRTLLWPEEGSPESLSNDSDK